ncbi:DUF4892 domain-containing protein [Pseudomonas turukhanskensis]|uniref:DUF4892 domain-containing protein n=1 Tax=Pseudomonas turukhanskensis TaxID=1806536 RepID=A0A9W6K7I7_9PSED|nr:DUF4892 domain-containing protein [Pseudomonas turukhanskensis]GLK88909.1 DUF4892 domain-containing protein [Pseudomonas turukhanskensis]
MRLLSLLAPVLLASSLATTASAADLPGSQDLEILPRFPRAEIVDFRDVAVQERIYPLGSIRRISGTLRYERQVDSQGRMRSVTYELPPEHTSGQAFNAARDALQAQGAELLYWCESRECGSASLWANSVFGNAKLLGAEDQQAYLLLRLAEPQQNTLVALYSITRGNRRAYLHVEQLDNQAALGDLLPGPATLLRQLRNTGELNFASLDGEPLAAWAELLGRTLNQDSTLRVSLAGKYAQAWRDALVAQRVRAARMEIDSAQTDGLSFKLLRP